jgi:peptidoglycan-N-acetylglucosamine deacetylase
MSAKLKVVWLVAMAAIVSCSTDYKYKGKPQAGICISFDDAYVDEWFELREAFQKYDANVTFFVTKFDTLTPEQIQKLKVLQADGHEIGFHGAHHVLSEYYIKDHSLQDYVQFEIVDGIASMNEHGFYPTSFAYPYGAKYWGTDRELLKYFYVVRSSLPTNKKHLIEIGDAFYSFGGERIVYSASFDKESGLNENEIEQAMIKAGKENTVLMLYAHSPQLTFDVNVLEKILSLATTHQLKYFRVSDLVK